MRISDRIINPTLKRQIIKTLAQTLADCKDSEETLVFLKDFLKDNELETYAKRLAVSYWLKKGRSYENIKTNLKVSSATIATIQNQLESEGYKLALKKMEAEEWANAWIEKIKKFVK